MSDYTEASCSSSGTCEGRCGGGSDHDCWCDHHCVLRGDCCCDVSEVCQETTTLAAITDTKTAKTDTESTIAHVTTEAVTDVDEDDITTTETFTRDPDCNCHTNDHGPVKNGCCVFPYTYSGQVHTTCVEVERGVAWCATQVDTSGHYIPGQWGYCADDCYFATPTPYQQEETTTAVTGGDTTTEASDTTTDEPDRTGHKYEPSEEETTSTIVEMTTASANSTEEYSTPSGSASTSTQTTTTTLSTSTETASTTTTLYKASHSFIQALPPQNSIVAFAPDLHDPVRVNYW